MIHVRELNPTDAPDIGRVEALFHSRELADGAEGHRQYLEAALAEGVNLSFGLFDDGNLVGYLLSYGFEPSGFQDLAGEAIYVEDIAVLPRYRRLLPLLFKRLANDVRKYFPGAPFEAHAVASIFSIWQKHAPFFSGLGFPLSRHRDTGEMLNGQVRYLIRWEPADVAPPGLPELLTRLPGHSVEVDGQEFVLKVLQDEVDWQALESCWDELLLATPGHTVFQSYDYQRLWWRHFAGDSELFIVLVVRDGIVVGIAPLQIRTVSYFGQYCHQLTFIGSRWEVDRPVFLFPGDTSRVSRALVGLLAHRADRWDICDLHEQITDSPNLQCLEDAFRSAGYMIGRTQDSNCPYLVFEGTWQQFLSGKSQTFRKNLKTAARRLKESGELRYQTWKTEPEISAQLETYREIEARSWKAGEGVGISRNTDYYGFYRDLAQLFGKKGLFSIRMLSVDGKAIAGTFGLEYDGVFYSLQIVHDREFSRCSPGTYLEALEMEECFKRGYREYEFLGGFLNNKSRWTQSSRQTTQLHVYQPKPRLVALYLLLFRIKPLVKELVRPFMKSWRQVEHD